MKEKEGTHKTFVSVRLSKILTIPTWIIETWLPFGRLIEEFMLEVIDLKRDIELIMWIVALVLIIQGVKNLVFVNEFWLWAIDRDILDMLENDWWSFGKFFTVLLSIGSHWCF